MKHLYASRWNAYTTQSAANIFLRELTGQHLENPFITKAVQDLHAANEQLTLSLREHTRSSKGKEAERVDKRFNRAFRELRNLAEMQGKSAYLGEVATASRDIAGVIRHFEWNLHKKSYHVQIDLFERVVNTCEKKYRESIEKSGLQVLFTTAKEFHTEMQAIVDEQGEIRIYNDSIPAPYKVAEQIQPLILMLHRHLTDFSKLDPENYNERIDAINARLKPIITYEKRKHSRSKKN